jgi:hypothetical protein
MSTPPSIFTRHAVERMDERGITADQVWETMTLPEVVHPDRHGNTCYMRQIEDRWVRVVVSATTRRIVTVVDTDEDRR